MIDMPRGDGTGPVGRARGGGGFFRRGAGLGNAAGPGGFCVCPSCGKRVQHTVAQPCNQLTCPQCGTLMTRE